MKKKRSKKPVKVPPKNASAPGKATPSEMPPPEVLFREAEQEPDFRTLSAYADSIRTLRDKGFSYREIAHWLSERGVDFDHNAVYRVHRSSLSDYDAHLEDLQEDQEAHEEARRN
jgi:hypothetical protein